MNKKTVTRLLKADDSAFFFCAGFLTMSSGPCEKFLHVSVPRSK